MLPRLPASGSWHLSRCQKSRSLHPQMKNFPAHPRAVCSQSPMYSTRQLWTYQHPSPARRRRRVRLPPTKGANHYQSNSKDSAACRFQLTSGASEELRSEPRSLKA